MATDSHGIGIPLPADSTKIHEFPKVVREGLERTAEVLAGGMTEAALEAMAGAAGPAVEAALNEQSANFARSVSFLSPDSDEGFLGDATGRPSKVGFDVEGEIASATMLSAHKKGMPLASPGPGGLRFQDTAGNESWLGWDAAGAPDAIAKQAIINTLHAYTGPDRPFVWPGNYVVWTRTDDAGNPLETLIGRN